MSTVEGRSHGGMVIVGAGECGTHAAFALRDEGWGGDITLIGDESLHAYERPPLSKASLLHDSGSPVHPHSLEDLERARIKLLVDSKVSKIHSVLREVSLANGQRIGYTNLLLAVGATPRRLGIPVSAQIEYLRTYEDALRIRSHLEPRRRVCVVGAGLIGLEVAASARSKGCDVTVIELADRALGRAVPREIADEVTKLHEANGVRFRWSASLARIADIDGKPTVEFDYGDSQEYDAVIVGVGAIPNIEMAVRSGLAVENGITVDSQLRTSVPGVYAAGDCASFPHVLFGQRIRVESWRNALDQAKTAAANMVGKGRNHETVPWFWSDQYDHSIQVAGFPPASSITVRRVREDGVNVLFGLHDDGRLVSAAAFGPGNVVAKDIKIAELLIANRAEPSVALLSDPTVPLMKLRPQAAENAAIVLEMG